MPKRAQAGVQIRAPDLARVLVKRKPALAQARELVEADRAPGWELVLLADVERSMRREPVQLLLCVREEQLLAADPVRSDGRLAR